jgi:hypothetical protein
MAMTEKLEHEIAQIGVRLLDDAYLAWFAAECDCEQALHAWFAAGPGEREALYFSYLAAMDREEAAARDLQRLSELAKPCCGRLVRLTEDALD